MRDDTSPINRINLESWYSIQGNFLSNKKKQNTDTCSDVGESHVHHTKQKKPDSKDHILYDSICMIFWKRQKYREKTDQGLTGLGVGGTGRIDHKEA